MSSKSRETLHACLHNVNFMIGFFMLLSVVLIAIFADKIAPYGYTDQLVGPQFTSPGGSYLFGTDELGRDVLSRRALSELTRAVRAVDSHMA